MPTRNYKKDLLESLKDPEEAAAYINAKWEDEDPEVLFLALKDIAESKLLISKQFLKDHH